ncbi:Hypothetical protein, putative [Bodo saltans]|uniref:Uncharacterized protein n=1 Tax=Bodo saltans TaxID=75058 RepID=A0A0S4JJI2_BODSA|nr:Hypothetical protein, putative [Bodo saltans]|eukprot:CUG91709.1 Hypothetical protein, putative [Bodo saltans]
MQHYIDTCAEKDVSCIFEILRALELLELRPQQHNNSGHRRTSQGSSHHLPQQQHQHLGTGGYKSGWRFAERSGSPHTEDDEHHRPYVQLELAPVMGPLALMEKTHRPGRVFNPADDPSMKLQLDLVDVECLTEALRRSNNDGDVVLHRPLLHVLVAGAEAAIMTQNGAWVGLISEWRKHILSAMNTLPPLEALRCPPSVFAARGCSGGLRFLVSLVEEAMSGPVSIDITSALTGGANGVRRRSASPFSTVADASTSILPHHERMESVTHWGLDVSCNTFHNVAEHQQRAVSAEGVAGCLDSLKILWRHHGLRHLSLAYCDLAAPPTNEGGSAVVLPADLNVQDFLQEACASLSTISLRGCPVVFGIQGNSWVRACATKASLWTLVRLDVSKMELTDDTAIVLADAIKRSTSLTVLMARQNYFTQVGFAAFAESLVHSSCCLQELFLGLQSTPPPVHLPQQQRRGGSSPLRRGSSPTTAGPASPETSAPQASSSGPSQILQHIRGATPSLYGDGRKAQRPPTELETVTTDDAEGAGSYHTAATNILVALGGNTSIRVCDLTGLPFDEPPPSTNNGATEDDSQPPPFIILSALSDLILNTSTLRVLCLTFPSTLQTPMRRELRRASTNTSQHYPLAQQGGGGSHHVGPAKPALSFPSKALFDAPPPPSHRNAAQHYAVPTQSSQARVSTGGPLDAFVQPPMRFSSSATGGLPQHSATGNGVLSSSITHQHNQLAPHQKLDRFAGPTNSGTSSINSSVGSIFHLASGLEFEEFLVAVNTQRELRGLYSIGVRNGCPQEAAALELFVQHPLDVSGFVSPPIALVPTGEHKPPSAVPLFTAVAASSATVLPPPPAAAPTSRRGSPHVSSADRSARQSVPNHRQRSVDSVRLRRPSPTTVAPFRSTNTTGGAAPRPEVTVASSARRPVMANASSALPAQRGSSQRWGVTPTATPQQTSLGAAAATASINYKLLLAHHEAALQNFTANVVQTLMLCTDAKVQLLVNSYSTINGRAIHDALERVDTKWASLRDREILLRQEMQRAIEERQTLEERQRELDRTEGEVRYRFKQLEEQTQRSSVKTNTVNSVAEPQPQQQREHTRHTSPAPIERGVSPSVHTPVAREVGHDATVMTAQHSSADAASPVPRPPTHHHAHHKVAAQQQVTGATDCRSDSTLSTAFDEHAMVPVDPAASSLTAIPTPARSPLLHTPHGRPPLVASVSGGVNEAQQSRASRGSLATSPMEAPTPAILHVSPHPMQTPATRATPSSIPSLLRAISTMRLHTVCATYGRFQAAMSALSAEERASVEAMWSSGRSAALEEGPGASIHPHRLALVSFIAACDEQYLFGESPRRISPSKDHSSARVPSMPSLQTTEVVLDGSLQQRPPAAARLVGGEGNRSSSRELAGSSAPHHQSPHQSPPSQSLNTPQPSVPRHLQYGSSARPEESPKRRNSSDGGVAKSASRSGGGSILKTSAPLNPPMSRSAKKGVISPHQRGARVVVLPTTAHVASTPPRINSLSIRRRTEVLRRYDEELSAAQGKHEQIRGASSTSGQEKSPRKVKAHNTPPTPHHQPAGPVDSLELSDRQMSSESRGPNRKSHPRAATRLSSPPNPTRSKSRRIGDDDDHPTESVQFDMEEDRTSSLDFEEYEARSDVDEEDFVVEGDGPGVGAHSSPPARLLNPLLLRSRFLDDEGHDKESIKFDDAGTIEASPEYHTDDGVRFRTASSYVHKRDQQGDDDGNSVGSSVNFDEEHHQLQPEGSGSFAFAAVSGTGDPPQVDLFSSLKKDPKLTTPPAKHPRHNSGRGLYVDGSLLSSPTSQRLRVDPKVLKDTAAVARQHEFVRTKIMPLSVAELRTKYPAVRTMLESMSLEEYEGFMDAWSSKYRHGHANARDDLQELMVKCALCGMFR